MGVLFAVGVNGEHWPCTGRQVKSKCCAGPVSPAVLIPAPALPAMADANFGRGNNARRRHRRTRMGKISASDDPLFDEGEVAHDEEDGLYADPSAAIHPGFIMPEVVIPDFGARGALRGPGEVQRAHLCELTWLSSSLTGIFTSFQVQRWRGQRQREWMYIISQQYEFFFSASLTA